MRKKVLLSIICFIIIFSIFNLTAIKAVYDAKQMQNIIQAPNDTNTNTITQENDIETNNDSREQTNTDNNSKANNSKELESNKYIIDNENEVIYRVLPETNVDTFINSFSIPEDIKVFEDENCENEVTDKYIGTGMVLRNETNNEIYKISVIGDFNSDGRITQIELTNLIRHVVGLKDYRLSGYVLKSADINNDKVVNHIDITLLIRYNVYGELDIEENKEIKSPDIEIVEGTEGNNQWYISDIKFRVKANEKEIDKIDKTTYKISGSKIQKETEIQEDEIISLNEGTYLISAYTYSKSGFKSLATRKTIKIDKTKPKVGQLNMWINEVDGEKYVKDTWTNQNVVLQLIEGSDELSGHAITTYSVKDNENIPEGTIENKVLENNGIYRAIVKTEDLAGNSSTIEYIIKIDKSATSNPDIKVISGNKAENSDWYIGDSVVLQVINGEQADGTSKIVKTTYKVEGTVQIEETEIEDGGTIIINQNGTYTITAYSINEAGQKSDGVNVVIKKDNTIPDAPGIEVTEGTRDENSDWYINNVSLQVKQTEVTEGLSPISKITYTIEGATTVEETEIENDGTIKITSDGISTIRVYNYNEAGTRSPEAIIIIKKDTLEPNKAIISAKDIQSTAFTLVGEASDVTSGVIKYDFYLDEKLLSTIQSSEQKVEVLAQNLSSGIHKAYVIVTDAAGHTKKSQVIDVKTERLTESEIDYFEFVVTKFEITDDSGEIVDSGALSTISDTSLTPIAKYIMINSTEQNIKGTIEGKIRLVRKDGTIVEEFDYFPNDLIINMSYYSNGSGTNFAHEKQAVFFGVNLNLQNVGEGQTVNTNIEIPNLQENKFTISDKKQTGTQTYTRATIESISLNGENIPFRILQE